MSFYSGAFSNVYEARDTKTGKKVAIKVAQKSKSDKMVKNKIIYIVISVCLPFFYFFFVVRIMVNAICIKASKRNQGQQR